jgi:hypothetical protein
MAPSDKRDTAERAFVSATKPVQRSPRARTEQEDEIRVIGEKTARLRSLRLARDVADKKAMNDKAKTAADPKRAGATAKTKRRKGDS